MPSIPASQLRRAASRSPASDRRRIEERELFLDYRDCAAPHRAAARRELMERFLPLVETVAAKLTRRLPKCVEMQDLVSAGVFGLAAAIDAFDPERGNWFGSYAQGRIWGAMMDWIRMTDVYSRQARKRMKERGEEAPRMLSLSMILSEGDHRNLDLTDDVGRPARVSCLRRASGIVRAAARRAGPGRAIGHAAAVYRGDGRCGRSARSWA